MQREQFFVPAVFIVDTKDIFDTIVISQLCRTQEYRSSLESNSISLAWDHMCLDNCEVSILLYCPSSSGLRIVAQEASSSRSSLIVFIPPKASANLRFTVSIEGWLELGVESEGYPSDAE